MMGIEAVQGEHPFLPENPCAFHKVYGFVDAPGSLVPFFLHAGLDIGAVLSVRCQIIPAVLHQELVIGIGGPVRTVVRLRMMGPLEKMIAIVNAGFHQPSCIIVAGRQVKLACQAAVIAVIGENSGKQPFLCINILPVLPGAAGPGITAGKEASPAGRAYGALCISVFKQHPFGGKSVQIRGMNPFVSRAAQCIKPLLIRTNPQNIHKVLRSVCFSRH